MSTRQPVKRSVLFTESDLPGFLDMLRYDGATVASWSTVERGGRRGNVYEVTLQSAPGRTPGFEFTVDRWHSFGLNISDPIR